MDCAFHPYSGSRSSINSLVKLWPRAGPTLWKFLHQCFQRCQRFVIPLLHEQQLGFQEFNSGLLSFLECNRAVSFDPRFLKFFRSGIGKASR
jgi:hypothetical protein